VKWKSNEAYLSARTDTSRYCILYGGAGSGKSYFAAQKIIFRCLENPGERFLVLRKVARTIKGSTFQLFRDIITKNSIECAVNRSEAYIVFPNGSEIVHAGLDDVEKLKSIAGITSTWPEEATEMTPDDFDQIDLRLRGECPSYHQHLISFNPIDARHWLKERFFDSDPKGTSIYKTTWRDNAFIDDNYKRMLQTLRPDLRAVYDLGEWGMDRRGLIYPEWRAGSRLPFDEIHAYGLDFGYNAPSALVAIQIIDPVIRVRELLYSSHLTNNDLIGELSRQIRDKSVPIYCDNAEPARIEELARAGFQAYPADKSVNDGIDTVLRYELELHPDSHNLRNEIIEYKWVSDRKTGEMVDKPLKKNDHLMDAMRYAIHSHCAEIVGTWGSW